MSSDDDGDVKKFLEKIGFDFSNGMAQIEEIFNIHQQMIKSGLSSTPTSNFLHRTLNFLSSKHDIHLGEKNIPNNFSESQNHSSHGMVSFLPNLNLNDYANQDQTVRANELSLESQSTLAKPEPPLETKDVLNAPKAERKIFGVDLGLSLNSFHNSQPDMDSENTSKADNQDTLSDFDPTSESQQTRVKYQTAKNSAHFKAVPRIKLPNIKNQVPTNLVDSENVQPRQDLTPFSETPSIDLNSQEPNERVKSQIMLDVTILPANSQADTPVYKANNSISQAIHLKNSAPGVVQSELGPNPTPERLDESNPAIPSLKDSLNQVNSEQATHDIRILSKMKNILDESERILKGNDERHFHSINILKDILKMKIPIHFSFSQKKQMLAQICVLKAFWNQKIPQEYDLTLALEDIKLKAVHETLGINVEPNPLKFGTAAKPEGTDSEHPSAETSEPHNKGHARIKISSDQTKGTRSSDNSKSPSMECDNRSRAEETRRKKRNRKMDPESENEREDEEMEDWFSEQERGSEGEKGLEGAKWKGATANSKNRRLKNGFSNNELSKIDREFLRKKYESAMKMDKKSNGSQRIIERKVRRRAKGTETISFYSLSSRSPPFNVHSNVSSHSYTSSVTSAGLSGLGSTIPPAIISTVSNSMETPDASASTTSTLAGGTAVLATQQTSSALPHAPVLSISKPMPSSESLPIHPSFPSLSSSHNSSPHSFHSPFPSSPSSSLSKKSPSSPLPPLSSHEFITSTISNISTSHPPYAMASHSSFFPTHSIPFSAASPSHNSSSPLSPASPSATPSSSLVQNSSFFTLSSSTPLLSPHSFFPSRNYFIPFSIHSMAIASCPSSHPFSSPSPCSSSNPLVSPFHPSSTSLKSLLSLHPDEFNQNRLDIDGGKRHFAKEQTHEPFLKNLIWNENTVKNDSVLITGKLGSTVSSIKGSEKSSIGGSETGDEELGNHTEDKKWGGIHNKHDGMGKTEAIDAHGGRKEDVEQATGLIDVNKGSEMKEEEKESHKEEARTSMDGRTGTHSEE